MNSFRKAVLDYPEEKTKDSKYVQGLKRFYKDPVATYRKSIERKKQLIEKYKRLIRKYQRSIERLEILIKTEEDT